MVIFKSIQKNLCAKGVYWINAICDFWSSLYSVTEKCMNRRLCSVQYWMYQAEQQLSTCQVSVYFLITTYISVIKYLQRKSRVLLLFTFPSCLFLSSVKDQSWWQLTSKTSADDMETERTQLGIQVSSLILKTFKKNKNKWKLNTTYILKSSSFRHLVFLTLSK